MEKRAVFAGCQRGLAWTRRYLWGLAVLMMAYALTGSVSAATPSGAVPPALIDEGRRLFFEETFAGNGRTCGTCHRAERDFALDADLIATLPADDPLFVADPTAPIFNPALEGLEDATLLRTRGLIVVNVDGFDQPSVLRASPHLLNLQHTGPPFGLSDHITTNLRDFSISAIRQHFPRTLNRVEGVDFRLPTETELEALEAFMLSLIVPYDGNFDLDRLILTAAQQRGRDLFFDTVAKCSQCHGVPALNEASEILPGGAGNRAFNTGVARLSQNADLPAGDLERAFGTPTLFGIRHTGPFFHNNAVETLREAVAFYNSDEFKNSPAAAEVGTIELSSGDIDDLVAFLEALTCPHDGDVNRDDRRTPADAALVLRHFLDPEGTPFTTCERDQADVVNPGDGVTPADVLCIWDDFLGRDSCFEALVEQEPMSILPVSCTDACTTQTGEVVALSVQVRDANGEAIPQLDVMFDLFGEPIGMATTDAAGIATQNFMREVPGVFLVSARVSAATELLEARFQVTVEEQRGDLRVIPQPCSCRAAPGEEFNLGVRVLDDNGRPRAGARVEYLLRRPSGDEFVVGGLTDDEGLFVRLITLPETGFFIVIGRVGTIEVPFYIVIRSDNAPPLLTLGDQRLSEGANVVFSLGLSDPDSDPVRIEQVAGLPPDLSIDPATATIRGMVSFRAARNSPYTIDVVVSDGVASTQTTLTWVVDNVNRPPVVASTVPVVAVSEDAVAAERDIVEVFTDPDIVTDGDVLTLALSGNDNPQLVTATLVGSQLTLSFLPDQNGAATVQLQATDTAGAIAMTDVTVAVGPVPDAPRVANAPSPVVVAEDAPEQGIDLSGTFADPDIATDDDVLQLSIMDNTNPDLLTAMIDDTTLRLTFLPDQNGFATLTVRATDQTDLFAETMVEVAVTPVNDAPMANDDEAETLVRVPVTIDVLDNDRDIDSELSQATVRVRAAPANGQAEVQANGRIIYTPDADPAFIGDDTFSYTVTDDSGAVSNRATVRITVIPVDLLVSSASTDTVLRYDGVTGAYLGPFVAAADGNLLRPQSLTFGPDGNLYAVREDPNAVLRFDGQSGVFLDVFVVLGRDFDNPRGLVFGPDNHLYVSCEDVSEDINGTGMVVRYDGQSGDFLGRFITPASGGLDTPGDLVFGPDNHLYVSSSRTNAIIRYNGQSGSFINAFVPSGSGGLDFPTGLRFGPDDVYLYVSSAFNDRVLRYNGQTGSFIDSFVAAGSGGLDFPRGLVFDASGSLYVSSLGTDAVLRYDGSTGDFVAAFVPPGSNGLDGPSGLAFADGNLYVTNNAADPILRYDGSSGAFLGAFVRDTDGGLRSPCRAIFGADNLLYVSSSSSDEVLRYNGQSGAFLDTFVTAGSGGLDSPCGLVFGPDGHLYVSSANTHAVLRYDGSSGAFLDTFVPSRSGGLDTPQGIVFGADGRLYVSSRNSDQVLRYDGGGGEVFVAAGSGGLENPQGLTFGPDGHLYVSSDASGADSDAILRYDGQSGDFMDAFVPAGVSGLDAPSDLVFADGDLYVSSLFQGVFRYDGSTGEPVDTGTFVAPGSGGLGASNGLVFGPDGNLYVTSGTDAILRYDGQTGVFIDTFIASASGGLVEPFGLTLGADGDLYVSSRRSDRILRYDGQSGAFLNTFTSLANPNSLAFGPDGRLYVSAVSDDRIRRYDAQTGAFIDVFDDPSSGLGEINGLAFGADGFLYAVYVPSGGSPRIRRYDIQPGAGLINLFSAQGFSGPRGLVFGPNGDLYVADTDRDNVFRFEALAGILPEVPEDTVFITPALGGLDAPEALTFGTDGQLYVSSNRGDAILRYDGTTGAFIDAFVPARRGGLSSPRGLLFIPRRGQ